MKLLIGLALAIVAGCGWTNEPPHRHPSPYVDYGDGPNTNSSPQHHDKPAHTCLSQEVCSYGEVCVMNASGTQGRCVKQ